MQANLNHGLIAVLALASFAFPFVAIPELTQNGDFETGDTSGWEFTPTEIFDFYVTPNSYSGSFAGGLWNQSTNSTALIRQANLGVGVVNPGDTIEISFAAKVFVDDDWSFASAEFSSRTGGGGVSSSEVLGGGPLPLTAAWQEFVFTVTAGPDVSGGVTLEFAGKVGLSQFSFVELFVDDVSVRVVSEPGSAFCFGDGSGTACPCGNDSASTGEGCEHSGGVGMLISGSGTASITNDDLTLTTTQVPPNNTGIFYTGTTSPANTLYDGVQCAGGSVRRFGGISQSDGTAQDTGFVAQAGPAYFQPGGTYHFQFWSRDVALPGPCGTGANFSPGYAVTMTP